MGFLEVEAGGEGGVERAWLSEWEREGQQCGHDEHAGGREDRGESIAFCGWVESSGRHGFGGVECGQEQDWVSDLCPVTVPCYSQVSILTATRADYSSHVLQAID